VTTKRLLPFIPFSIAIATIVRCWIEIATSNLIAQWQHYSAIAFAAIAIYFAFRGFLYSVISVGIFFILGTMNAFSMTSSIESAQLRIAGLMTPPFNGLSLGLLFLYLMLNSFTLINLYLDRKERIAATKRKKSSDNSTTA
jgi:hypothetical protein